MTADGRLEFPEGFEAAEMKRRIAEAGYPEVNRLHQQAVDCGRGTAPAAFLPLKDLMEAVPVGSDMWQRWQDFDAARGYPPVPPPGKHPVVYYPRGGPEAFEGFADAATPHHRQRRRGPGP